MTNPMYVSATGEKAVEAAKEIVKPDSEYHPLYSLKKSEVDEAENWEMEHSKKFHKKGYGFQGAVGVSRYRISFFPTSIGVGCNNICEICYKKFQEKEEEIDNLNNEFHEKSKALEGKDYDKYVKEANKKNKKLSKEKDKLYKQAVFSIRDIDY